MMLKLMVVEKLMPPSRLLIRLESFQAPAKRRRRLLKTLVSHHQSLKKMRMVTRRARLKFSWKKLIMRKLKPNG